jgi:hypothetical protein
LIAPAGVCDDRPSRDPQERIEASEREAPFRFTIEPWIEAGGTALVWLSPPPIESEEPDEGGETVEPDPDPRVPEAETREVRFRHSSTASKDGKGAEQAFAEEPDPSRESDAAPDADRDGDRDGEEAPDAESVREDWRENLASTRRELREGEPRRCAGIAGIALPPRHLEGLEGGALPEDADYAATAFSVGRWVESRDDFDYDATRLFAGPTLAFFDRDAPALAGWQPVWVETGDFSPFALERELGQGRLIVIADARVMTNARLGRLDSAPFAFDWVAARGVPWIDEHRHGVVRESGTFRYLASSPARAACVGLLVLGGLVIWRSHSLPVRRVDEVDPDAPTLAAFVDSLARLYAGTEDHARAFERYRALTLDRVRRALGLPLGTPAETVVASLRVRAENRPGLRERGIRDLLQKNRQVRSAAEFERAAARLDELVRVLREHVGTRAAVRRGRV